jgi:hypothetical protein
MGNKSNVQKSGLGMGGSRVVSVASGYALHRVRLVQPFTATTRAAADLHVDTILARGNYAAMTNVGNQFVVKELVMA